MPTYYNEFEPYAAAWLRNLIAAGHIAAGDVDERPIQEVKADDLKGYTQCHFFAGIGGWSYALRLAGWPDDRPVWTGSCPCQPFSNMGKRTKQQDGRHLWPYWSRVINELKPNAIFGEQVDEAITTGWIDDVFHDLEEEAYSCSAFVLPACSVGSPQQRDRVFFLANRVQGKAWDGGKSRMQESETDAWQGLVLPPRSCMVDGVPESVATIGAYGNAIVPQVAAEFIKAAM